MKTSQLFSITWLEKVYFELRWQTVFFCCIFTFMFCAKWHFCDRKSRATYAQSFALWQQATIEFTWHDHSLRTLLLRSIVHIVDITRDYTPRSLCYCLFAPHICMGLSSGTSRSWWITQSTQHHRRGCNSIMPLRLHNHASVNNIHADKFFTLYPILPSNALV